VQGVVVVVEEEEEEEEEEYLVDRQLPLVVPNV
jgi:hypothetical protein